MKQLADRLDRAAESLAALETRLPLLAVPRRAFGAEDAGVPGRLGHDLHKHWTAVLTARSREAAMAAARVAEMADSVRKTQEDYTAADESVAHRLRREMR